MKILHGFVQGVIEKQGNNGPYAVVAINDVSKNRDGFEETNLVTFNVAGQQFKAGLHNAYRSHAGAEVFAPYSDEINVFNGKTSIRYNLQGAPLRIQQIPPVQDSKPAGSPVQQPGKPLSQAS